MWSRLMERSDTRIANGADRPSLPDLYGMIPDVGEPLAHRSYGGSPGTLVRRQIRRRAEILGAARRQIALGNDEINIARIGEACGITVQTVYNLVGDRRHVLAEAVDEYYRFIMAVVFEHAAEEAIFHALAEALWASACRNPDYMRNLSRSYFSDCGPVRRTIEERMRRDLAQAIQIARKQGCGTNADVQRATGRLHALIALSASEWVNGKITLDGLRLRLLEDTEIIAGALGRH
jgi:AcrR family transcriptional regulator